MRSERFVPVSDILPRISATVIVLNYKAILSAEQKSVMCSDNSARHTERHKVYFCMLNLTNMVHQ